MKNIEIQSERLIFIRLSSRYANDDYLGWLNDPEVTVFLEINEEYTLSMLQAYIEQQSDKGVYFWAIHLRESNKHIGNIKIDPIDFNKGSGEYGIMIGDKNSWGKGYAKEASYRIIKYCFDELGLNTINLGVIEENTTAVELYTKMGFSIDEVNMNVGVYNGQMCNSLRMSINKEDFD